jgi:hypothetical protein
LVERRLLVLRLFAVSGRRGLKEMKRGTRRMWWRLRWLLMRMWTQRMRMTAQR